MPEQGWIKLHRQIQAHWLWEDKPFSKGQAWIDLLLLANHKDNKSVLGSTLIDIERGSFITSELKLMERWGWSKSKVRKFLTLLEYEKMILKKSDNKKTTITVVNYDIYQDKETTEEPQKNRRKTAKEPQKDTNKNDKNVKNEKNVQKNIYAEFVSMTEAEYQKLVTQYGEPMTKRMIEVLNNYKGSKGKKYKSDYLTILNWVVDRVSKEFKGVSNNGKSDKYSEFYE